MGNRRDIEKPKGGRPTVEYMLKINTAKELAKVENNQMVRKIRRYFIEIEERYLAIVSNSKNIFDCIRPHSNLIGAIARQLGYKRSW